MIIRVVAAPEVDGTAIAALDQISLTLSVQQVRIQNYVEKLNSQFSGITRGTQALGQASRRLGLTLSDLDVAKEDLKSRLPANELDNGDL